MYKKEVGRSPHLLSSQITLWKDALNSEKPSSLWLQFIIAKDRLKSAKGKFMEGKVQKIIAQIYSCLLPSGIMQIALISTINDVWQCSYSFFLLLLSLKGVY